MNRFISNFNLDNFLITNVLYLKIKEVHFVTELTGNVRCMDQSDQGQNPFRVRLWSLFIPYEWANSSSIILFKKNFIMFGEVLGGVSCVYDS